MSNATATIASRWHRQSITPRTSQPCSLCSNDTTTLIAAQPIRPPASEPRIQPSPRPSPAASIGSVRPSIWRNWRFSWASSITFFTAREYEIRGIYPGIREFRKREFRNRTECRSHPNLNLVHPSCLAPPPLPLAHKLKKVHSRSFRPHTQYHTAQCRSATITGGEGGGSLGYAFPSLTSRLDPDPEGKPFAYYIMTIAMITKLSRL